MHCAHLGPAEGDLPAAQAEPSLPFMSSDFIPRIISARPVDAAGSTATAQGVILLIGKWYDSNARLPYIRGALEDRALLQLMIPE